MGELKEQFQFTYQGTDDDGTIFTATRSTEEPAYWVTWKGFDTADRRGIFFPAADVKEAFDDEVWKLYNDSEGAK